MNKIKSPCINKCNLNPKTSLCEGCFRSLDEIKYWVIMTDNERVKTLDRVENRKKGIPVISDPSTYELTRQKRNRRG